MLWLVCLFVTAAHFTQVLWKATLEREIRWGLYRVRDELRWAGIQNPDLLADPRFWELDDSLTLKCRHLHNLSLWPLLVIAKRVRADPESVAKVLRKAEGPFLPFYEAQARLTMQHLMYRHMLLGRVGLDWFAARADQASTRLGAAAEYLVRQASGALGRRARSRWTLRSKVAS